MISISRANTRFYSHHCSLNGRSNTVTKTISQNIRYTFAGKCRPVQLGHKKLAKRNKETKKQTSTHTDRQQRKKQRNKERKKETKILGEN